MLKEGWVRASRSEPCVVCGRPSYCGRTTDGTICRCMRVESPYPSKGGWIHRLSEPLPKVTPKPKKVHTVAWAADFARRAFEHPKADLTRHEVAHALGVSVEALLRLQVGYACDRDGTPYASFPSRDAAWNVLGITRRYTDGSKKTLYGTSNSGVFLIPQWDTPEVVYVVEGASDVAAMFDHGLSAIGRPSNTGGAEIIAAFIREWNPGRVVVVGENDQKLERVGDVAHGCRPKCSGCAWCWPGKHGAFVVRTQLSKLLKRKVSITMPPRCVKDARHWLAYSKKAFA